MKYIRGLYMVTIGIVALPFFAVMMALGGIWLLVVSIREHYTFDDMFDLIEAVIEGIKVGHAVNMHFVKYGNKPYTFEEENGL